MKYQYWRGSNNFVFLLISFVVYFIGSSFLSNKPFDKFILGLLFTVVLFLCAYTLYRSRRLLILGVLLGVFSFLGYWASHFAEGGLIFLIAYALTALFFLVVTHIVIVFIMTRPVISVNTICGAVCGYILIGIVFSFIYGAIYIGQPDSFFLQENLHLDLINFMQNLTYFSFVSLTSLGYGDITPVLPIARTFSWLEAGTGQIYLTVLVARLVSLQIAERQK